MNRDRLDRNLRLLYAFNFLKSAQFFGAVAVPFFLDWEGGRRLTLRATLPARRRAERAATRG